MGFYSATKENQVLTHHIMCINPENVLKVARRKGPHIPCDSIYVIPSIYGEGADPWEHTAHEQRPQLGAGLRRVDYGCRVLGVGERVMKTL